MTCVLYLPNKLFLIWLDAIKCVFTVTVFQNPFKVVLTKSRTMQNLTSPIIEFVASHARILLLRIRSAHLERLVFSMGGAY